MKDVEYFVCKCNVCFRGMFLPKLKFEGKASYLKGLLSYYFIFLFRLASMQIIWIFDTDYYESRDNWNSPFRGFFLVWIF